MADLTLELELPGRLDAAEVSLLLRERLRVEVGRAAAADRVLLDTFDARLRSTCVSASLRWWERPP